MYHVKFQGSRHSFSPLRFEEPNSKVRAENQSSQDLALSCHDFIISCHNDHEVIRTCLLL
jgi:hypothetical protein